MSEMHGKERMDQWEMLNRKNKGICRKGEKCDEKKV